MPYISATAEIMYAPLDLLLVIDVLAQKFSNVLPEVCPRIFGIQAGQFAQNFFGALIPRHGDIYLYLNDFIAACTLFGGGRHAFFPQAQLLTGLCPGRNFKQSATIDCRDLNFAPQGSLRRRDGDSQINIIALATENRMIAGADDDIEIARGASTHTRISFAGDANTLAVASSRLDAHFQRLGALDGALAVTDIAGGDVVARAITARTGDVELHASAGLLDRSFAFAFRTDAGRFDIALARTVGANIAPGDVEAHHTATDSSPKRYVNLIFKIVAGLRAFLGLRTAAA